METIVTPEMRAEELEHREAFQSEVSERIKALALERAGDAVEPLTTLQYLEAEAVASTFHIPWDPVGEFLIECRMLTSGEIELYLKLLKKIEAQAQGDNEAALETIEDLKELKELAGAVCVDAGHKAFFEGPKTKYDQVLRLLNEAMGRSFTAGARVRSFREE